MALFTKNDNNDTQATQPSSTRQGIFGGQVPVKQTTTPQRPTSQQNPSPIRVTTTSGKQYTLDGNATDWIKTRYRADQAGTYGYDDADQQARRSGQMSAKWRSTYGNSNVDTQLAQLGLPSEKNLEKYIAQYDQWHTGGIKQVMGDSIPANAYSKIGEMYKQKWSYENTAEDQARKAKGIMPSALAAKYTDTEIDDELMLAGLPSISEFSDYLGKYNNYAGIENLYTNAAGNLAFMKLNGIKDDNEKYTLNGEEHTGKEWYAKAFYDELGRADDNGNSVYASIMPLLQKSTTVTPDPNKSYVEQMDELYSAQGKKEKAAAESEPYSSFSYNDFMKNYDSYYENYWKNAKLTNGQTMAEAFDIISREQDAQQQASFYDIRDTWLDGDKGIDGFIDRYMADYPDATPEQMFTDMLNNGVSTSIVHKTMKALRKGAVVDTPTKQNRAENGWGFKDIGEAYQRAIEATGKKGERAYKPNPENTINAIAGDKETKEAVNASLDDLRSYVDEQIKFDEADEATIAATADVIKESLGMFFDPDEGIGTADVNSVLKVLHAIEDEGFTNPVAMQLALKDLGFYGAFSGFADDLTAGWSDEDKRELIFGIGSTRLVDVAPEDRKNEFSDKLNDLFGVDLGKAFKILDNWYLPSQALEYQEFQYALEWAEAQVADGKMTKGKAYNILAAAGYAKELEEYVGKDWHEAHFKDVTIPEMYKQTGGATLAMWEGLSPELRAQQADAMWADMTDEQKSEMFNGANWWKSNPTVYKTFGQALTQQFEAVLPGLAADIISGGIKVADAITANLSGRPEMWDTTQDWMKAQQYIQNFGSVTDGVNGAKIASVAADVVQELGRMYFYGSIGGAIGAGFAGTSAGSAVMAGAASDSAVVRGASKMFMSMVKSSPFVVSAFANNYSEAKALGASNSEATWFGLITGLTEGILEGFEFDELWGRALGQGNFAKQLALGKATYLERLGIIGKAWISSAAVSGLGEFTEESIGYVLDTFLKMRHSDTWGKGTEWSASDWLQQAMMGFITGALGGGIAAGGSFVKDGVALSKAIRDNPSLQSWLPDILAIDGEANTMPKAALDAYRKGGATVLSRSAYDQLITEIENNNKGIENYTNTVNAIEASRQKAIGDAQLEVDKLAAKLAPYITPDASGNIPVFPAEVYDKEFAPLMTKYQAALKHLDYVTNNMDPKTEGKLREAKSSLQNSLTQKETLAKKEQEHWAGLFLMNEHLHGVLSEEMIDNLSRAYQNGATYDPNAQAEEAKAEATSKLAEAEANETVAEAEQAAQSPEDVATKARELAYNRVYKDQEAGKAYAEGRRGEGDSKLTRVQFAENERQNFQAKTTAKLRRVTLELAGLEAKDGMSAKEIFAEAKKAMTPEAAQKLEMYQKLSKALGLNMVVRDVVAGTSGYVHDGKLYVTLNGKQSMLRVASHELTHYMAEHARGQYDVLRNHLINEVGGQEAFDKRVAAKAEDYGLDLSTEKGRLEADDEVCAELCEKMLENKDALERFVSKDMDAAKTLKTRLAKTLVAVKSAIRSIGTSDANTKADLIKEQDTIESWYRGLSDAIDAANAEAKAKAKPTAETVTPTETTATAEQPQAPPAPEGNPDLYMGDEEARKEQLRSDLVKLAEKGTKVKGLAYQEVNDVLDRVIFGDKSNYSKADYAQIRGMLAQLIPEVQAMVNGDESVDVDALNERVSTALDYMLDRYQEVADGMLDFGKILPNKIALTDAAYNELRARDVTLREASNRLRKALGGQFVSFVYKRSPEYGTASKIDQIWQEIAQYDPNYDADTYGNIGEDALALIDYVEKNGDNKASFNDLYGSQREDVVNAQVGEFLDAVQSMVEGKNAEQDDVRHMADVPGESRNRQTPIKISDDSELARLLDNRGDESPKSVIARYIMSVFDGQAITMTDGRNVIVDNHDAGKLAQYPKPRKTAELSNIRKIIETAVYDHSDTNAIHNKFKEFHYYIGSVEYGNNTYDVELNVGVTKNDGTSHLYDIRDWQNNGTADSSKTSPTMPGNNAGVSLTSGSSADSITGNKQKGNTYTRDSLDDDYMPLAEKYDAGIATDTDVVDMDRDVEEAASDSMRSSVVRNQDGTMQRLYHGSLEDFTVFDKNQIRAVDYDAPFNGFWFSSSENTSPAMADAKFTKAVFLNIENPAPYDVWRKVSKEVRQEWFSQSSNVPALRQGARSVNDEVRYRLQDMGYDGIHYSGAYNFDESNIDEYNRTGTTTFSDASGRLYDLRRSEYGDARLYPHNSYNEIMPYDTAEDFYEDNNNEYRNEDVWVAFEPEQIKSAAPVTYDNDGNIIPLSERFDPSKTDIRWTVDDDLDEMVKKYGAIDQGRNPRARDTQVPRRTNDNNRVSQWIRSLVESDKLTDDQAQNVLRMVVEQDYGTYVPTSQAERMQEAREYIAGRQPLQAQQEFHDMVMQGKFGVKTNALGIQLLSDASARGDIESVLDIASDLQLAATEAGQSAQIFNVLKELKGVGSAWYMQKVIDRMNSKYADRIAAGKMQKIAVDPALMADLAKATTVDQIAAAEEAVAKDVARQLPLTWDDRLSSWRYFSMLANPTTHIRNITGNLLMKGLNAAKDVVATGIEKGLGIDQSQRAHAVLTTADRNTWGGFAQQSYEEQAKNLSGGGKLGFETFIKQNMRSFDTKWVNALAKFNFNALEGEDIAFIRPAYKTALMQYMKAQGYTLNNEGKAGKVGKDGTFTEISKAEMNAAIDWASNQAWKATFRDASSLATMLNKLSKENAVSRLLVEGVMPFKKTPVNIAKRGLEYSPAGIIMGTTQLLTKVKQGKMSAASAIDNLASGITGTALMALGVFLAKAGVIRAGGEDKKKYETYLEDTGDQTYSFKFGDASVNMSSIAPATIPLFMGVALQEMIGRSGDSVDLSTITDVLAGTLNPFMDMSFMSSLNSALKNYNNDGIGGALGSTLMTAAQNYGSQYLPTLGGKVAQFIDPTVRSTKSDATSPVGGNLDYYVRSLAKKVPGLEATLQPDVDVWGRTNTKDSFTDWALDFANKFILPTNVKVSNRDAVDKELIRVVESTGVTDFLPSDGNKYFTVKGVKYTMNAKQYAQYSQERGQAAYAAIKDVMASSAYVTASDEDKANMLNKAKEAAYKAVNNIWKEKLGALD